MKAAQELYEGVEIEGQGTVGLITYMRTDSLRVSEEAQKAAAALIKERFGPRRGCPVSVDGVTLDSRADSRRYPMQHGSILCVGEAVLQLGVFAGLDVQQYNGAWMPQEVSFGTPVPQEEDTPFFRDHGPYPADMPWSGQDDDPPEGRDDDEA